MRATCSYHIAHSTLRAACCVLRVVHRVQAIAAATPAQIEESPESPDLPIPAPPALGVAGGAPPSIAAVYTPFEFQDAVDEGVRDIEIHSHLDVRNLPIPVGGFHQIGQLGTSTRSIRVSPRDKLCSAGDVK